MLNINELPPVVKAIKPICGRVLILLDEAESETKGGILLAPHDQEKSQIGTIIAVAKNPEMIAKVGDKALFGKYAGLRFEEDGVKLLFIKEAELMALLDN